MEVKRDYKNAIIHQVCAVPLSAQCQRDVCGPPPFHVQTLKSAIGMKESEESSGLSSPKLR